MTKGRCKHCRHIGIEIKCDLELDPVAMAEASCKPGEDYRDGLAFRTPCDTKEWRMKLWNRDGRMSQGQKDCLAQQATCEKFTEPTDQEVADHEAEMEAHSQKFMLVVPLIHRIKKEHKGESWKGIEVCPACGGKLHMRISSYNGHVWGKCETENCLAWME